MREREGRILPGSARKPLHGVERVAVGQPPVSQDVSSECAFRTGGDLGYREVFGFLDLKNRDLQISLQLNRQLIGHVEHIDSAQRVPLDHAKKYRKLLDKYNKNYKYLELEGADHFSSTLFFNHQIALYESMIDFLENDCGRMSLQAKVSD